MPTPPACSCGRPAPDATICRDCTRELGDALRTARAIAPDLDDAVARLLRRGPGSRSAGRPEPPLPIDVAASDASRALRVALAVWAYTIRRPLDPAPEPDIRALAKWLGWRLLILGQHDRADAAHREITAAVRAALVVIDRAPERIGYGKCDTCSAPLFGEPGTEWIRCSCGTVTGDLAARRERMIADADLLGTADEIAAVLAGTGRRVASSTIRTWATRRRLEQRPAGSGLYRLSDVLALVDVRDARA